MAASDRRAKSNLPETHWGKIKAAAHDRDVLGDLVESDQPVLVAHLVLKRSIDIHQADDIVQEFVCKKFLEQNLLQRADPKKGRFRSFLHTALDNFAIDWLRKNSKESGKESLPENLAPADFEQAQDSHRSVAQTAWAMHVLAETIEKTQRECRAKNRLDLWGVFEGHS